MSGHPRPADFEAMSDAEFEAYIERTGFAAMMRQAETPLDGLWLWPPDPTVTERADRWAWVVVAVLVAGVVWWWLSRG